MDERLASINEFLVTVFNDILTIEESELKKSSFDDLSIKEMHTIDAIGMYKKKTTTEVAKELSVTTGTLTVAVNHLVRKGYVERLRSEDDRRVVKLGLTNKGRLVFRVHNNFHKKMVEAAIVDMNPEQEDVLIVALAKLHRFLQDFK